MPTSKKAGSVCRNLPANEERKKLAERPPSSSYASARARECLGSFRGVYDGRGPHMNLRTVSAEKPPQEFLRSDCIDRGALHLAALARRALSVLPNSGRLAASQRYQFPRPTRSFNALSIFPSCHALSRISLRTESKRLSALASSAIARFASETSIAGNAQQTAQVNFAIFRGVSTLRAHLWSIRGTFHLENDDS